ncbi:hypothetical protein Gpo141_00008825 [Globisporangium polare]
MAKDGFLNVRKPPGMSSHKCVQIVRKIFQTRHVGHGGTLDPMATGVLTMALGKATKFLQYLTSDKEYNGVIRFGMTTDSDDITGEVLSERAAPWLTEQQVHTALQRYIGAIDQMPPRVSAIKKDGVRLYELARNNQQIDVPARRVHISSIDLRLFSPGAFPEADIQVGCGAGTYIRSIARECGEALLIPREHIDGSCELRNASGDLCVGGTLTALERSRSGIFGLDTSLDFDEIRQKLQVGENPLQPIDTGLTHLASVKLPMKKAHRWQIGGISWIKSADVVPGGDSIECPKGHYALAEDETIRVYSSESSPAFLGISQVERQPEHSDGYVLRTRTFA